MTMASILAGYGGSAAIEAYYKNLVTKGFFTGGSTAGVSENPTADRTTYSTETTAYVSGANLVSGSIMNPALPGSYGHTGYGNSSYAYFMGFFTANKTTFSNETTSSINGLPAFGSFKAGAGDNNKGYCGGGNNQSTLLSSIGKTLYSNDTSSSLSTTLSLARASLTAVGNLNFSFFNGGATTINTYVGNSDKLTYATETSAASSGTNLVSENRSGLAASGSDTKCFIAGGQNYGYGTTYYQPFTERITYATQSIAYISGSNLSLGRSELASTGSIDKAFYSGGYASTGVSAVSEKITFSSETRIAVTGANLTSSRYRFGAA